jgi:hypothetical protein
MEWVENAIPRLRYPQERPNTLVQEAGWALALVWTAAGNFTPTRIRSPSVHLLVLSLCVFLVMLIIQYTAKSRLQSGNACYPKIYRLRYTEL